MVCAEANTRQRLLRSVSSTRRMRRSAPKPSTERSTQLLATGQPAACVKPERQHVQVSSAGTADCCKLSATGPSASDLRRFANRCVAATRHGERPAAVEEPQMAQVDQKEGLQACRAVYAFPSALRVLQLMNNDALAMRPSRTPPSTTRRWSALTPCPIARRPGGHKKGHSDGTACGCIRPTRGRRLPAGAG